MNHRLPRCRLRWAAVALVLAPLCARADARPTARASFTGRPPRIDGLLDDEAWRDATPHGGFVERRPLLGARPPEETTFYVLYDAEAIYFGVRCVDSEPNKVRGRSVQRDSFALFADDAISIKLDPLGDRRTTLGFALSASGAQLDYRGINESEFRVEFDAVWQAAARRTSFGWSAELRIPLSSLGIDPHTPPARIGLNLSRDHSRRNATYDWSLLRPPFGPIAASLYGDLLGLDELPRRLSGRRRPLSGLSLAVLPYALLGFRLLPQRPQDVATAGLDARLDRGEVLSLHLSINTDFAQVDLDDQRINLGRFGLFFPEKRDFFLRDLELFTFGRPQEAQLLQTRRIGLRGFDVLPLLDGLKLLGRPRRWLRLGLLQAVTLPAAGTPWTLYLVGRAQAELGGGSNIGVMATHRQSLQDRDDRNLVLGVDGALRSTGGLLLQAFALLSLTGPRAAPPEEAAGGEGRGPHADQLAPGLGAEASFRGLLLRPQLRYAFYHPALRTDLGFFRRVGVHDGSASLAVEPRFQRRGVERLSIAAGGGVIAAADGTQLLDWHAGVRADLHWIMGFALSMSGERLEETVQAPFPVGPIRIPAGRHGMNLFRAAGHTPSVWSVSGSVSTEYRDYYGGQLLGLQLGLQTRPLSLLRAEVGAELSRIWFADDRGSLHTGVLNGRVALGFTPRLGLDLFLGWNSVADLVRVQGRLRFRYAEGSDLFVVYQHDLSGGGTSRFQTLLVKVTVRWPQ